MYFAVREGREKRWPNTEDIITEVERIITKSEIMEIELMLVDTTKTGTKKVWNDGEKKHEKKARMNNSYSFYWKICRLWRLNDSFKIPIDINNLKDSNLLLQKKIEEKDAKRAVIGIPQKVKIEANVLIVKGQDNKCYNSFDLCSFLIAYCCVFFS